jgi:uncharacterized membrane protein YkvA (DUF1232 family)
MLRQVLGLLQIEMLPVVGRLPAYSRLGVALVRAREVRPAHKVLLIGGVAYLLSPIDIIPGFIPVLGQLDDLSVALWALRRTLRALPAEVAGRHLEAQGLTWDLLDGDLGRVGRSGRLLLRAGLSIGQRVLTGAGRTLLRVGLEVLERRGLPRRIAV